MSPSPAEVVVSLMAREIHEGAVVATGVASPLAILAIAVARATHAPSLTYLACVGAVDPTVDRLFGSSEDLRYLGGRVAELGIPELFDHARRGRVDTIFFGAAEVDGWGDTNLSAAGGLSQPKVKFPGVAGACSLRRWAKRPVLVVGRQSRRNLVPQVQLASTRDRRRQTRLLTDLGLFELGPAGATLLARHPHAPLAVLRERTGFEFAVPADLPLSPPPTPEETAAMRRVDPSGMREQWVG
ncbi:MAG TPA: CoA-transferase [Myxococcaceae bacterium]|nr:CoA-transferase [Myxococcaceae bacterium]